MPRENRKRGKKHKKTAEDVPPVTEPYTTYEQPGEQDVQAGPSWIVSTSRPPDFNAEAPFGYVDAEVKAYFRTVDVHIRQWQEEGLNVSTGEEESDPNEDRKLFFVAALTEMSGKEKELATDPDCSNILERMAHSMDDFARRVFMDRLTGSYKTLAKHRFASHVCQTFVEVAAETVSRESRGIAPAQADESEEGQLMPMKALILELCEELMPDFPSLIMDPFASHVLRALLAILSPTLFPPQQRSHLRSKKSAAHKARQGPMKSVFTGEGKSESNTNTSNYPHEFQVKAAKFVAMLREELGANEVRALAASQVASPVLQMLLEIEADNDSAYEVDSLADRVLDGMIAHLIEQEENTYEASDYVGTLLRDPTSSHLLETLVRRLPENAASLFWDVYLKDKLSRLAVHPVANFVVAKFFERATEGQLEHACGELKEVSEKIIKSSRTGVLRALVERVGIIKTHEPTAINMVLEAFGISRDDKAASLLVIPCTLRLLTTEDYTKALVSVKPKTETQPPERRHKGRMEASEDPLAPKVQGVLLAQAMLKVSSPHNQIVVDSLLSQPIDEQLLIARDASASRVLDTLLQSPTIPFKEKRKYVMNFIGHYHVLVDDRIGSRVADNCWAFADPYLREKIARSLIPHERILVASYYGKFFARNLNLYLLRKDPEQWKNTQTTNKTAASVQGASSTKPAHTPVPPGVTNGQDARDTATKSESVTHKAKEQKRKNRPDDEIDQLFDKQLCKKVRKAELRDETKSKDTRVDGGNNSAADLGLDAVFGAIQAAPKGDKPRRDKKKTKNG